MPGADEADRDPGGDLVLFAELDRLELSHGLKGIAAGEERARVGVPAVTLLLGVAGLFFLQFAGVLEHQPGERTGRPGAVDRSAKPLRDQPRQEAGVIEVGVGQDDSVDLLWSERERAPVAQLVLFVTLEEAAVDEQAGAAEVEQRAAAGDCSASSDECDLAHGSSGRRPA